MTFPIIKHISDVLPHIEGRTEFVVAEREGFTVINYMVAFDTTFPELYGPDDVANKMLRECRGLMFDREGKLISRPYHKFFNMNERPSTNAEHFNLEDASKYVIMDKLDGSFIRPVRIDGKIRLCTKMGVTEQSEQAEAFVAGLSEEQRGFYEYFFETYVDHFTPVFEFCSRKNQIVIDYPEDKLVLTGMRRNEDGEYVRYGVMKSIASAFKIPVVEAWHIEDIIGIDVPRHPTRVVDAVRSWIGIEGVVLRYNDGRMVKIKAEDYCIKHGAKDALLLEKNVLKAILNQTLDDVLPLLDDAFKARVEAYKAIVSEGVYNTWIQADMVTEFVKKNYPTRKDQAKFIKENVNPFSQSIIFGTLDGKDTKQLVVNKLLSNCGSQSDVDAIKFFIGNPSWS